MGISRATASKWVSRYKRFGDIGLLDRSSTPRCQPSATDSATIVQVESMRRQHKWSAARIEFELTREGIAISRRTVSRVLLQLGLNRRRFIDPNGESNREPQRIVAERPGHMVYVDVKKVGRIPDGGGWRVHGRDSPQARAVERTKKRGSRSGYAYLHSAVDGHTRLAYSEALDDEQERLLLDFSNARRHGSQPTASPRLSGSSPTTARATDPRSSQKRCSRHGISESHPSRRAITGKLSDTTGSSPKSSSTPEPGAQNKNELTGLCSGTCTTTTTGRTAHTTVNHQHRRLPVLSRTSWPHTAGTAGHDEIGV